MKSAIDRKILSSAHLIRARLVSGRLMGQRAAPSELFKSALPQHKGWQSVYGSTAVTFLTVTGGESAIQVSPLTVLDRASAHCGTEKVCCRTTCPPCLAVTVALVNCTSVTVAVNGEGHPACAAVTLGATVVTQKWTLPFLISVAGMVTEPSGETGTCCPGGLLPPRFVQTVEAIPCAVTVMVTS